MKTLKSDSRRRYMAMRSNYANEAFDVNGLKMGEHVSVVHPGDCVYGVRFPAVSTAVSVEHLELPIDMFLMM